MNGILVPLCTSPEDTADTPVHTCLQRPYFGMHRFEWTDDDSVEFHIPHGEMLRLLRVSGFDVLDLIELQAAEGRPFIMPPLPDNWAPVAGRRDLGGPQTLIHPLQ